MTKEEGMSPRAGQKGKRKIGLPKVSVLMLDPIYW